MILKSFLSVQVYSLSRDTIQTYVYNLQTGGSGTWLQQISQQQIHQQPVSAQPHSQPSSPEPQCNDLVRQGKQYVIYVSDKATKAYTDGNGYIPTCNGGVEVLKVFDLSGSLCSGDTLIIHLEKVS